MVGRKSYWFAACLCLSSPLACGDGRSTTVSEDSGALCMTQEGSEITIDARLGLICGCSHASRGPECQASFESGSLVVTSRLDVTVDRSAEVCPDGCFYAVATCVFAVPAEGEVPVAYGTAQATVSLPLTRSTPLFGADDACPDEDEE
jgi:hypothetical protein